MDDTRHLSLVGGHVESAASDPCRKWFIYSSFIPFDVKDTSCASWTRVSALSHRGGGSAHRNKVNRYFQVGELS